MDRRTFIKGILASASLSAPIAVAQPDNWRESNNVGERLLGITLEIRNYLRSECAKAASVGKIPAVFCGDGHDDKLSFLVEMIAALTLDEIQKESNPRKSVVICSEAASDHDEKMKLADYLETPSIKDLIKDPDNLIKKSGPNINGIGMAVLANGMYKRGIAKEILMLDSPEKDESPADGKFYLLPGSPPKLSTSALVEGYVRNVELGAGSLEINGRKKLNHAFAGDSLNIPLIPVGAAHLKYFNQALSEDGIFYPINLANIDHAKAMVADLGKAPRQLVAYKLEETTPKVTDIAANGKNFKIGEEVWINNAQLKDKFEFIVKNAFNISCGLANITNTYDQLMENASSLCAQARKLEQAQHSK